MTRILADLPDEDIKWLDQLAAEQGKSRAAVLREAVAAYRPQGPLDWIEAGFGAWARHGVAIDPRDHDRQRRAEWTRPGEDDYEEVRTESPEYFTEEDASDRSPTLAPTKTEAAKPDKT